MSRFGCGAFAPHDRYDRNRVGPRGAAPQGRASEENLEAAFEEFSRSGYAATSLDKVAERGRHQRHNLRPFREQGAPLHLDGLEADQGDHRHGAATFRGAREGSTAELLRAFIYEHIVVEDRRRRKMTRMLVAEASRFPALVDRYYEEVHGPRLELLKLAIKRGVDRGEIRRFGIVECPQVMIALFDVWLIMYDNRKKLDLKAYFSAHLDLVLNGLLTAPTRDLRARSARSPGIR
jgi:hypothetical protein